MYADAPADSNDELDGAQEPCTVSFDNSYRRLLVGFSRGACRVYNYNNGSVIHELLSDATGTHSSQDRYAVIVGKRKAVREMAFARGNFS